MSEERTLDIALECLDEGSGQPVVLVHGSASDHRTWVMQRPILASSFRVITYSRRYHWPNEAIDDDSDYAVSEHVDDLVAILESLGGQPAHVVGHSYGGVVALMAALREPQLFRSMVLEEPAVVGLFIGNPPRAMELFGALVTSPRIAITLAHFGITGLRPAVAAARRGDLEEALRRFGIATLGRDAFAALSAERLARARANNIRSEYVGSGFTRIAASSVRTLRVPTLIITGDRSPIIWHRLADHLARLLPDAGRVTIRDASHIVHEDNPTDFNIALAEFLRRHT